MGVERRRADAREYLLGRGLSEGALRAVPRGLLAARAWDTVLNASRRAGYGNEEAFAAGLAVRGREGRIYDVFRGKVMFPLADRRGRMRGFGARAMRDGQGPKYVNTREGEVFSQGAPAVRDRHRAGGGGEGGLRGRWPRATPT